MPDYQGTDDLETQKEWMGTGQYMTLYKRATGRTRKKATSKMLYILVVISGLVEIIERNH